MSYFKLFLAGGFLFLLGCLVGWSLKPTNQFVDKSWEFFPRYDFKVDRHASAVETSVEALRPSYPHSSGYRLDCCDCDGLCHRFRFCQESHKRCGKLLASERSLR